MHEKGERLRERKYKKKRQTRKRSTEIRKKRTRRKRKTDTGKKIKKTRFDQRWEEEIQRKEREKKTQHRREKIKKLRTSDNISANNFTTATATPTNYQKLKLQSILNTVIGLNKNNANRRIIKV